MGRMRMADIDTMAQALTVAEHTTIASDLLCPAQGSGIGLGSGA